MTSKLIPFGEWMPDQPDYGNGGAITATNVIPGPNSYLPFPSLVTYTNSIGSRCKGGIFARDTASNSYNYVGDSSALYALTTQSWSSATRLAGGAYTVADEDYWEFVNWGQTVIGVAGPDNAPQQISLGASNFTDLAGSPPKARHITTMRDFVVLGNISDSATNVYRVRWCGINNPTSWSVDATTLADYQDLPAEGGWVQRVLGGENVIVLQERSITNMRFVGAPLVFQFDRIHSNIGAYIPQSAVRYQNLVFFLAEDGFYAYDGSSLKPIGQGKVDSFFFDDFQSNYFSRVNAVIDPANKLVLWAYPSANSVNGNPDRLLVYSYGFDKWALVDGLNIEYLMQSITTGYTLDGLDAITTNLDSLQWSLDARQWTGGQIILSAFNSSHQLGKFNGSAMSAIVETGEFQGYPERRTYLTNLRPVMQGLSANISLSVINRNNLTESASIGSTVSTPTTSGMFNVRNMARYQRVRLTTSNDFEHLQAVEITASPGGVK